MLKFVLYEDNPDSLERAITIIHRAMAPYDIEYKIEKHLSYSNEIEDTINKVNEHKIYILDIEVPKVSGLEIASKIREKDWKSIIIFVTSHPECKNDIFYSRLLALDYISKYNSYDKRLQQSIEKSLQIFNKLRVLTYKYNYVSYRIDFDEILYIEKVTRNKKSIIHTENGTNLEMIGTIKEILGTLDNDFCMSSQSCIVNLSKIQSIDSIKNIITFKNKLHLDKLSSKYKKILIEKFNNYR